jgi:hypothetical protein
VRLDRRHRIWAALSGLHPQTGLVPIRLNGLRVNTLFPSDGQGLPAMRSAQRPPWLVAGETGTEFFTTFIAAIPDGSPTQVVDDAGRAGRGGRTSSQSKVN